MIHIGPKTTIVSGFNPAGYLEYGGAFMDTYAKYWPPEVAIIVYVEERVRRHHRVEQRSLWDIDGVRKFIDEHQDPKYHGRAPVPGWHSKDHNAGESYRYNAVKFCRQLFIPEHAAAKLPDGDVLAWFDADCVSYAEVPEEFILNLLGDDDLITVGRDRGHTDIGFWAVRLNEKTRALLTMIANSYRDGSIFKLNEWHSGFLFDYCKDFFITAYKLKHRTLTNGNGHVWFKCEIGKYTDHLKGPTRKRLGYSPERNGITIKQMMRDGILPNG